MASYDEPAIESVKDAPSFLEYASYFFGTPTDVSARIGFYRGFAKFLEVQPEWGRGRLGWDHLAKTCRWAVRNRRRRPNSAVLVLYWVADAVKDGALPELEQKSKQDNEDDDFYHALSVENDPKWRGYLMSTRGSARTQAVNEWKKYRA